MARKAGAKAAKADFWGPFVLERTPKGRARGQLLKAELEYHVGK